MVYMTFRKQILSPQVHCPGDYNCKEKATESFYLGGFLKKWLGLAGRASIKYL
jgi:hypothetical protein